MTTGRANRQTILRNTRGALGRMGLTTATASATHFIRDATRYDMDTRATSDEAHGYIRLGVVFTGTATAVGATTMDDTTLSQFGTGGLVGAIVRMGSSYATITSHSATVLTFTAGWTGGTPALGAYVVDYAHVAKIDYIDPSNGDMRIDPVSTDEVVAGTPYEIWYEWPDDVDAARDKAAETRCSPWRVKVLSKIIEVADWSQAAWAAGVGGESNAAATVVTLAFPEELFEESLLVTNSGATGYDASPSVYVQPTQQYRIWGRVSVRAEEASVRVRDITNTADITLSGTSTFTLRGWQWFEITFTVPTGCGEVQIWLGGAAAGCISEWAGVGILCDSETMVSHESRVLSEHDLGHYYAFSLPTTPTGSVSWTRIDGVNRRPAGDGVMAVFDAPPACPVYYSERHRYAA
ncbi:MAG: hypothetical protein NUW01_19210, partial [Gemmatimonadaceae bacterium]|nr:hypothetical protein [Gemmatimonadaceae bacterium]